MPCDLRIGGFVLALVIVSSLSTRGYSKAQEGFDVTNCAAAKMVTWHIFLVTAQVSN